MADNPNSVVRLLLPPTAGLSLALAAAFVASEQPDYWGLVACFSGILATYCLDALRDTYKSGSSFLYLISLGISSLFLIMSLVLRPALISRILVLSALAIFYIPLKNIVLKNVLTAAAWSVCVICLPLSGCLKSESATLLLLIYFIIFSNTILCDIVDLAIDQINGVPTIASLKSPRVAAAFVAISAAIAFVISLTFGLYGLVFILPIAYYLILSYRGNKGRSLPAKTIIDAALLLPGLSSIVFMILNRKLL